jgi:DNA-directed RNA polymerase subunit M/transcription elongation factor TFIIS
MNFNTTSHDNDNRIATDIVECPKCDSENVLFKDQKYNSYNDVVTFFFACRECNNKFKEDQ